MSLPSISVLIPTLNSENVLGECLASIKQQDYPVSKVEIIIADGGSSDQTLSIAKKYKAKIFNNPLKTGEAGKAVALKHAKGELIALIDSDNILLRKDWLRKMILPFSDKEIIGAEPWQFSYRKKDGFIDRYCSLLGVNDPYCFFLGNYDRLNTLTGKWTEINLKQKSFNSWIKVFLENENIPTIGANGVLFRKKVFIKNPLVDKYLFDIDVIASLVKQRPVAFAKVKISIVHLYCGSSTRKFIRKQQRRIRDYLFYNKLGTRNYPWIQFNKRKTIKFVVMCLTIVPLFYQSVKGFSKRKDIAWFFHPLASEITLLIYSLEVIKSLYRTKEASRKTWSQ